MAAFVSLVGFLHLLNSLYLNSQGFLAFTLPILMPLQGAGEGGWEGGDGRCLVVI